MKPLLLKLDSRNTMHLFAKKVILLTAISSLFFIVTVIAYYDFETTNKTKEWMKNERIEVERYIGSSILSQDKQDEYVKQKLIETMQQRNILLLEVKNNDKRINYLQSPDAPENIVHVFNNNFLFDMSFRDGFLLPEKDSQLFSFVMDKFGDKEVRLVRRLSSNEVKQLNTNLYEVLLVSIISILITTAVSFPFVYNQYKKILERERELLSSNINILNALGNAVAKRDSDTHEHNYRVAYYTLRLAKEYGLPADTIKEIIKGAFLHDIGKIAIPDAILLKPGKLTEEEFQIMKTHVEHGVGIVANIDWLRNAAKVISCHHEKYNGSGYPNRLQGEEIPIEARIFAVVDVFDALASERPYKEALSLDASFKIIQDGKNSHFDPKVVDIFMSIAKEIHANTLHKNKVDLETLLANYMKEYFKV